MLPCLEIEYFYSCPWPGGWCGSRQTWLGILDSLAKRTRSCAIGINPNHRAVPEQDSSESGRVGSDRATRIVLGKLNTAPSVRRDLRVCCQPQLVCCSWLNNLFRYNGWKRETEFHPAVLRYQPHLSGGHAKAYCVSSACTS